MSRRALAVLLAVGLAGCGEVSQKVTTPAVKRPSELGSYTASQFASARASLKAHPCSEKPPWKCGVILASGEGRYRDGAGWVAIVVRPSGKVETLTNSWSSNHRSQELDTNTAMLQYPPGITIRWNDRDHDNTVSNLEIEVIARGAVTPATKGE